MTHLVGGECQDKRGSINTLRFTTYTSCILSNYMYGGGSRIYTQSPVVMAGFGKALWIELKLWV